MKKGILSIVLALCLLIGIGNADVGALAENYTVYVSANTLKVYAKVSTSPRVLGTLAYGESMTCVAANSGWAAVRNSKGALGYCKISGLTTKNPNSNNVKAYVTAANTPVYRRPETGADVMARLKKNSAYTAVAVTQDGDWVRLQNGKYYGYVQTKYLSRTSVGDAPEASAPSTPSANTTVYVSDNTLRAYDRPSTSGKSLGVMSYGESMTLTASSGGWAQVRNAAGAVGYCKLSGLSTKNPNSLTETIYIAEDGAKAYRKPSTSAGVMQALSKGASYLCVAITPDGSWLRLKNGKYYGYVQAKYCSVSELQPDFAATTAYVDATTVEVYAKPDAASARMGTMSFGQSVTLLNVDDGWAQVRSDAGSTGYCLYGGLTRNDPNTLRRACYAAKDGVPLYEGAWESATVLVTAELNASLMAVALSEDKLWARIQFSGGYAYARVEDLSIDKQAENDSVIYDIDPQAVYVRDTNLNCYASNNSTSKLLGSVSFGEELTCTGQGNGWARVMNASGNVGYCLQSGLTSENPNTYSADLYTQTSGVRVYQKANAASKVLATLSANVKLTGVALSQDKSWVRLKNGSAFGYAQASDLSLTPLEDASGNSKISDVIKLAKSLVGIKYKYAAQSPTDGFDCSGFTYYVYKNAAGVTLKRTAKTQGYDGTYVQITKKSDLRAGDLVFFNTVQSDDDLCDHAGIYLGNNQFIHASSAKGEITISSLGSSSSDYYYRVYSWGRRILS